MTGGMIFLSPAFNGYILLHSCPFPKWKPGSLSWKQWLPVTLTSWRLPHNHATSLCCEDLWHHQNLTWWPSHTCMSRFWSGGHHTNSMTWIADEILSASNLSGRVPWAQREETKQQIPGLQQQLCREGRVINRTTGSNVSKRAAWRHHRGGKARVTLLGEKPCVSFKPCSSCL